MDRDDRAGEPALLEVADVPVAHVRVLRTRAEDGDTAGVEQRREVRSTDLRYGPGAGNGLADEEARVDGDRTGFGDDDRVEVDLDDLFGQFGQQPCGSGEVRDEVDECGQIGAHSPAGTVEDLHTAQLAEHVRDLRLRQRCGAEGDVFEDLDEDAAESHHDVPPDPRGPDGADDDFVAAGRHLFDKEAGEFMARLTQRQRHLRLDPGQFVRGDSDADSSGIGLVHQGGRDRFDDERIAQVRRAGLAEFELGAGGDVDSVGGQERFALGFGEHPGITGLGGCDEGAERSCAAPQRRID